MSGIKIGGGGMDAGAIAKLMEQLEAGVGEDGELSIPTGGDQQGRIQPQRDPQSRQFAQNSLNNPAQIAALQRQLPNDNPELDAVRDGLIERGLLPASPPPTETQIKQAAAKYQEDNLDRVGMGNGDVDEMFALIEGLLNRENARSNRSERNYGNPSRNQPAQPNRPSSMPSSSSPAYARNSGPARNQGELQNQAAQNIRTANPPPEPGSINARVAQATQQYMGTSTRAGPDGGNLACAWSVNNILANAGIAKVGSNTNYVPSVEAALQGGRGTPIDASQARPGDIVIWPHGHHIGIAMGNNQVANNSSSRAQFSNMQSLPAGARVYRLNS
jgi:cell wall-associated NlpC family hydrolase